MSNEEYLSIHKGSKVDDAVTTVRNNDCLVKYGNFIGTLSDQSDLQLALNAKVDKTTTINGYALSNSISLVPNDVNAADRNMSNLTETGVVKLRTYCLSTTGGTINGNEAITGTLTVTGSTILNGVTAVNNNFSVGGSITSTLKSTKINSTGSDGVLTASVTRGGYADMVTTTDAGNSNKRCATIRMNNSDSSHSITLGVHDYNDSAPSGLTVSRGVNDSTNRMTMTGDASITGALSVAGNTTMTGVTFTGNINDITPTEFGYLDGARSNIQTQIDNLSTPSTTFKTTLLNLLYPINSLYITVNTSSTCPIASTLGGTWTLVSTDRVLQGASSVSGAGGTKAAGLPNITGSFNVTGNERSSSSSGAFYFANYYSGEWADDNRASVPHVYFNASRSSSIYGNSSTVQPPAYLVNVWKRTA